MERPPAMRVGSFFGNEASANLQEPVWQPGKISSHAMPLPDRIYSEKDRLDFARADGAKVLFKVQSFFE
jgi:hypothetical protein